ncbi:hypothetical protein AQF52_8023 [Streptomyces venezuelae]|uniref:hypothetical protein n=1 Tax=Streptomyces gardneri TaxID=66892 RepID=UPI0006BCFB86|nr:hypothetical protein [Streptomyces gardneri]ALO13604.1 hypothetical protein AQF52_8023 [Streptomyces venezuelae]QPK50195.1 hypothetical protein H4W23_40230 [Streptomyces gardneri]WRK41800.1 hypothetical protein U0M97_40480 [Streptomyces venezuelae]CUM35626.1 hypothetical protein BN2537_217 [Streptomyces venezuelae]
MQLVAEYSVMARPDRSLIEIYDADAYLADEQAVRASHHHVVAGNGYHLYLRSLQPDLRVRITIRVWDCPPPPPDDAEGHRPVILDSETGILVINQLTFGPAGEMTLPQPGVYDGTTWWAGRQATWDYYAQTLRQIDDAGTPERIAHAWSQCPVPERYVLDLAYTGPSLPEDD